MTHAGLLKRWTYRQPLSDPTGQDLDLATSLQAPTLVAQILRLRGISDLTQAQQFLRPSLKQMHDPRLLPGVDRACDRIIQAVKDRQPIVIYGDYDVDGITASAILWHTLKAIHADVQTYIPHRVEEGYGLNTEAITELSRNAPVIITVDCGVTAAAPAQAAKDARVDLIITDHHAFEPGQLPNAHTIVHPSLPGSDYPCPHLAGAGVAFKLAWHLARIHCGSDRLPDDLRSLMLDLLALAALGTVADVVPLTDENRVLAACGLSQIKRTRFPGLSALIEASGLNGADVTSCHVGFALGPRLNACGRLGHAGKALELLITDDSTTGHQIAAFLTQENQKRRATQKTVFDQAKLMVTETGQDQPDRRAIVLGHEDWHPGVLGIVASRLVETFHRPTVLLNYRDGQAQGSARGVPGQSLHEALTHCKQHLTTYGGHAMAAGMRLDEANTDAFREQLNNYFSDRLAAEELVGHLQIDCLCPPDQITLDVFEQLHRLAPFGAGNPLPILLTTGLALDTPAQRIGKAGTHLRLNFRCGKQVIQAVAFGAGELANRLPAGSVLDAAYEPSINTWKGRSRAELMIKDIRPHTNNAPKICVTSEATAETHR